MNSNHKTPWHKSLAFTLLTWFLLISITPLLIFEYSNYQERIKSLETEYKVTLKSTAASNMVFINNWFKSRKNDISIWSITK